MKFPTLIHVAEEGEADSKYLQVYTDGVVGMDENAKAVAIYKLVEVGTVSIEKRFVPKAKARKRR